MLTPNRLAAESSLYLRQHANNPVDWYPWGPEALARSKELDRPIFLSIGYSACHWCHVMEHESFEDPSTAELLNQHFVCIKVDREERPDLDDIYMKAVQLLNHGQGGWPMSVWLTPDLHPFFAGTYFPPDDRYGRTSFKKVLTALANAWKDRRQELTKSAGDITEHLKSFGELPESAGGVVGDALLRNAVRHLRSSFDSVYGGFSRAPKFPHALELQLLLRAWKRFGDDEALHMVRKSLDHMARGGMYDQLGGGFHRYSVDARWLVPHFEKMLYDNALLTQAYLEAFQGTGDSFYRDIVQETLEYVLREMTHPDGGFYSSQDADSEGEEGKYFVWSKPEFDRIVGPDLAELANYVWGVTTDGNFEGQNILFRSKSDEQDAKLLGMPLADFQWKLGEARQRLFSARSNRVKPGRDEKILTAWNGLMIAAFAKAAMVLNNQEYLAAGVKAAQFVLLRLRTPSGRLLRTCADNQPGKLEAYLEDYAFLADALVHLYQATFDERFLNDAEACAEIILSQFVDAERGGFFATIDDHEKLILRPRDIHDSSTPSGNAMAVMVLLRLSSLLGRDDFRQAAERTLNTFMGIMESHPSAVGQMLVAYDFWLGPVQEAVVIGEPKNDDFWRVVKASRRTFAPRRIVAAKTINGESRLPLFSGRDSKTPVTLFLCENGTCQMPITDVENAVSALVEPTSTHR